MRRLPYVLGIEIKSVVRMRQENSREIVARYRESAEALRGIAATLRFDPRRRAQLIALANGFNRAADRVEQQLPNAK